MLNNIPRFQSVLNPLVISTTRFYKINRVDIEPASQEAIAAVTAVKNLRKWGCYAANRYCEKRSAKKHLYIALHFEIRRHKLSKHIKGQV